MKYLVAFLLISIVKIGLVQVPSFVNYSQEDGLPSNEIYHILQDSKGYLWFSTDHGVCRYDGHTFINYTAEDGLSGNFVIKAVEDSLGRIWFLTMNPTLSYFHNNKIHPFEFNHSIEKFKIPPMVKDELIIEADSIILTGSLGSFSINNHGYIRPLMNHSGVKAQKFSKGYYLTKGKEQLKKPGVNVSVFSEGNTPLSYKHSNPLHMRTLNLKGVSYLSPERDVFKIKNGKISKVLRFENTIDYMGQFPDGSIWIGVFGNGVRVFEGELEDSLCRHHYLNGKTVSCCTRDWEGGTWISVLGEGVYYAPSMHDITFLSSDLPKKRVTDITIGSKNDIYVSYDNGEIWKTNDSIAEQVDYMYQNIQHGGYNPIHYDRKMDKLWSERDYLKVYNANREKIASDLSEEHIKYTSGNFHNPDLMAFVPDDSSIWCISHTTLLRIFKVDSVRAFSFAYYTDNPVNTVRVMYRAIIPNYHNKTLVATQLGLAKLGQTSVDFDEIGMGYHTDCYDLEILEDHFLMGTRGSGVILCDKDGNDILKISEKDGLSNKVVNSIDIDRNGVIWVGTNHGLNKVEILPDNQLSVHSYFEVHGLPSNYITKVVVNGSKLLIGTVKGLVSMDIDTSPINLLPPIVHIDNWYIDGKSIELRDGIVLGYNENNAMFQFSGITFNNSENIRFQYRLLGLDDEWRSTESKEVRYNVLSPGEYTFQLRGVNVDGIISEPISHKFRIATPFWTTWWFIGLIISLTAFLVILLLRRRDKIVAEKIELKARYEKQAAELKLKALRAQINPHFTFNTLNSIQNYILDNDATNANKFLAQFARLVRKVLSNSEHNRITLENELEVLEQYLKLEKLRFKNKLSYIISTAENLDITSEFVPPTILQPYVENAVLHGVGPMKSKGMIKIDISIDDWFLICIIEDNGVGRSIESKQQTKGGAHGMEIGENRIELIQSNQLSGSVEIIDLTDAQNNATGTRVVIKIPREIEW